EVIRGRGELVCLHESGENRAEILIGRRQQLARRFRPAKGRLRHNEDFAPDGGRKIVRVRQGKECRVIQGNQFVGIVCQRELRNTRRDALGRELFFTEGKNEGHLRGEN